MPEIEKNLTSHLYYLSTYKATKTSLGTHGKEIYERETIPQMIWLLIGTMPMDKNAN